MSQVDPPEHTRLRNLVLSRLGTLERKDDLVEWAPSFFFRSPRKLVLRPAA